MKQSRATIADRTGRMLFDAGRYLAMLFGLLYLSVKVVWTNRDLGQRDFVREVLLQVYFTGVQALLPLGIAAVAMGTFVIVAGMGGLGAVMTGADQIGKMVTVLIIRELAPLLTGGIVIMRSVSAIAAELGGMRVLREIEAIEAMGISPVRQLITPRILGGLVAYVGLNVAFDALALAVGFLLAQTLVSLPPEIFFKSLFSAVTPADIWGLGIKLVCGGIGMFLLACYHGMNVTASITEVPVAVSRASLHAIVFLLLLDLGVSFAMLLGGTSGWTVSAGRLL